MIENYRSDFVWKVMRKNPYIRRGLKKARASPAAGSNEPVAPPAPAKKK